MQPKSFTSHYKGLASCLNTPCGISAAFNPSLLPNQEAPEVHEYSALWDTGAMGSVISSKIVKELDLKPTGNARVFHANGQSIVNTYAVSISLPAGVTFPVVRVTEGMLGDTDVLIGMDIISKGDFAVTCNDGSTKFSFQIPSTHDIDFVQESRHAETAIGKKPERNEPCPCGSGRKYKNCHGRIK